MTERPYLSIDQVAALRGVSRKTVRAWISAGLLPAARFGPRLIRINPDDLAKLGRTIPTAAPRN